MFRAQFLQRFFDAQPNLTVFVNLRHLDRNRIADFQMSLTVAEGLRTVTFKHPLSVLILVNFIPGLIDIDKEIFNIIHENGLVYNGRLIVKSNF